MSKRPEDEKLDVQSQKKVKMSSQEIEVSSSAQETQLKVSPIFLLISTIAPGFQKTRFLYLLWERPKN
jgi:hypothetical protein